MAEAGARALVAIKARSMIKDDALLIVTVEVVRAAYRPTQVTVKIFRILTPRCRATAGAGAAPKRAFETTQSKAAIARKTTSTPPAANAVGRKMAPVLPPVRQARPPIQVMMTTHAGIVDQSLVQSIETSAAAQTFLATRPRGDGTVTTRTTLCQKTLPPSSAR